MNTRNVNIIREAGLKATLPRAEILNLFSRNKQRHFTAEEIYQLLLKKGMTVGLATVYRVLTQFEEANILTKHRFEDGKAVFELNSKQHHDHIVCLQCGQLEEFHDEIIEIRQRDRAQELGFALKSHAMYLYADCLDPNCPNKQ